MNLASQRITTWCCPWFHSVQIKISRKEKKSPYSARGKNNRMGYPPWCKSHLRRSGLCRYAAQPRFWGWWWRRYRDICGRKKYRRREVRTSCPFSVLHQPFDVLTPRLFFRSVSMACKTLARLCHGPPLDDDYMQVTPPVVHSVIPLCKIGNDDTGNKLISWWENCSSVRNVDARYTKMARQKDPNARYVRYTRNDLTYWITPIESLDVAKYLSSDSKWWMACNQSLLNTFMLLPDPAEQH